MANTQEMIENLFKSIDLITDKKLEGLEYDKIGRASCRERV